MTDSAGIAAQAAATAAMALSMTTLAVAAQQQRDRPRPSGTPPKTGHWVDNATLDADGRTVWSCHTDTSGRVCVDAEHYRIRACDTCHQSWVDTTDKPLPPPTSPPGGYAIVNGAGQVLHSVDRDGRDVTDQYRRPQ